MLFRTIIAISLVVICFAGISYAGEGCDSEKACCPEGSTSSGEECKMSNECEKPQISFKYVYNFCNDVAVMKHFYSDLIGLEEKSYQNDEKWGWLCYCSEGFDMMFFRDDDGIEPITEWSAQPGWEGGTIPRTSWSILVPEEQFAAIYQKLKDAKVKLFSPLPQWRVGCYWGISVLDPMGNTVEVYTMPKEKPESTEWVE